MRMLVNLICEIPSHIRKYSIKHRSIDKRNIWNCVLNHAVINVHIALLMVCPNSFASMARTCKNCLNKVTELTRFCQVKSKTMTLGKKNAWILVHVIQVFALALFVGIPRNMQRVGIYHWVPTQTSAMIVLQSLQQPCN